jgi:hypothetical protein
MLDMLIDISYNHQIVYTYICVYALKENLRVHIHARVATKLRPDWHYWKRTYVLTGLLFFIFAFLHILYF